MEEKKKICAKCGKLHFCVEHHILPETIFGNGETRPLCPNCHDDFHRFLGFKFTRRKNAQPKEFYYKKWLQWISAVVFLGIISVLIACSGVFERL